MGVFFVEQKGYFHRKRDNGVQERLSQLNLNVFGGIFE